MTDQLPKDPVTTDPVTTDPVTTDSVTTDPVRIVEGYLYAMRDKDFDAMDAALDDDVVYQNVGLPIIRGRRRTMKVLQGLNRPNTGFDVKIHRIAAEGSAVLTERTDMIIFGPFQPQFWVCGVFEVRDGRITLWRDYFDFLDILKGTVRALAAIAVPALRKGL